MSSIDRASLGFLLILAAGIVIAGYTATVDLFAAVILGIGIVAAVYGWIADRV